MPRRYYSSTAQRTALASGVSAAATTLVVNAVTGFPASTPFTLILDQDTTAEEIVEVVSRSGTTLTVTRGVDGTTATTHSTGASVNHGVSARDYDEPNAFLNGTGVVSTAMLADGSVTTAKIADGAVATVDIADKAVTSAKVGSGAATVGQTLVADGAGGASWGAAASAGGGYPDIFLLMGA